MIRRREKVLIGASAVAVVLWTVVPFFWMIYASLMHEHEVQQGLLRVVEDPTLENYERIFGLSETEALFGGQTRSILRGFMNSFIVAFPTAIIGTIVAALAGYAFGRFKFPAKTPLLFTLLMTRVLPPIAILIPYFTLFREVGMVGNHAGLIITYLTGVIPLLTWVLMGYFATLPVEMERAARLDGCSRLGVLWYIILPMAAPGIAAAFIIAFLFSWNELLFGIILTGGTSAQTLSPALLAISPLTATGYSGMALFSAASCLSILPPLLLALVFQRYITSLNIVDPVTFRED